MINSRLNLVLAAACLVSLVGCLTSPSSQDAQKTDGSGENGGGGVSVRPMFLCGEGRAVLSVNESGSVVCSAPTLKGLASKDPTGTSARCEEGQSLQQLLVGPSTDPFALSTCDEPLNTMEDSVTLGDGPTLPFACPFGSALKGFTDRGEPICASLMGESLAEVALVVAAEDCPWGMSPGTFTHSQFSISICVGDGSTNREMKLIGQSVTKFANLNGDRCAGEKVVIGFTEDHDIICGTGALGLKQSPSAYLTTEFDGHAERPTCRREYHAEPTLVRRASGEGPLIKVWTCLR